MVNTLLIPTVLIAGAYLIGSVSSAIIVCRLFGLPDPRDQGSGNPGATNVLRLGGKVPAALTLVGDMLKGLIPAIIATSLAGISDTVVALAVLAAFLGHLFPVFFGFRGGKGVATALGALIGASWLSGLIAIACWLAFSLVTRISSAAALATFTCVPVVLWINGYNALAIAFTLITLMLFYTHRSNIARLIAGTEPRIGQKK